MENESQVERIIKDNPHQFKDELDKWLFGEFGIYGGACSSIESMRYSLAREVAEKAMEYAKQEMVKDAIEGVITFDYYGDGDKTYGCIAHDSFCLEDRGLKDNEEVKLVIIKDKEV